MDRPKRRTTARFALQRLGKEALVFAAALFCAATGYSPAERAERERRIVIE
ncbi:MAG: hypothetical protein KatS3mg057_2463 [Herpetosiphonaceae bacterium]|nr:MAG: hypothetical protein KatS3mg057_2463 [Herpetosiphonaceae bacterium]